jgi:hypothetical protein
LSAVALTLEQERGLARVQTPEELAVYLESPIFEEPVGKELVSIVLWTLVFGALAIVGLALWPVSATAAVVLVLVDAALVQAAVWITHRGRTERLRQSAERSWEALRLSREVGT